MEWLRVPRIILFVGLLGAFPSVVVKAEEETPPDTRTRLEVIAAKVNEETIRLTELDERRSKLAGELSALNKSVAESQRTLQALKTKVENLDSERVTVELEAQETDQRLVDLKVLTLQRVRALAMQRKDRLFEQIVLKDANENFARRAFFLRKIREHDASLTRDLQRLISQKKDHIIVVQSLLTQQKKAEKERVQQQQALEGKVKKLDSVKRGLIEEKRKAEEGLAQLRAEALRLETVMVGLTGGAVEESADGENGAQHHAPIITVTFNGKGLKSGGHDSPIQGKILQRFDTVRGKGFESFVKSKGVEVQADAGGSVKAIERGKVMYRGVMPGYGQIIILDHGDREYSLYGRIQETLVEQGAIVERAADIAQHVLLDIYGVAAVTVPQVSRPPSLPYLL